MSVKDALQWLNGKRVALCEPNAEKFLALEKLLKQYGLMVSHFNSPQAVMEELHRQQYSTLRVFLVILVDYHLARTAVAAWEKVTEENPTILQTPVVLMRTPEQVPLAQDMVDKGYFKYEINSPVSKLELLKVLTMLDRWKSWEADMQHSEAHPLASLSQK
ncbi:hypothetical protein [Thiosulfativibrio zosterae]|uniref:Response regulatory domain-containing protein n=1 Tax=Thiosulfativibrio zosterae TaxID=2675053 RepID=A0A6F8PQ41_9GAMM|nr:hypothetical protein [Thiosulfativibrio zosterae]BBP44154.1 hypothetical protein THMIRHAT_19000 [Thiosulfativibrio zosterae]